MKKNFYLITLVAGLTAFNAYPSEPDSAAKLTRMLQQSTLSLLKEGNVRFVEGKSFHPNQEISRRTDLATAGQEPSATILACSDSRDPVELIFDRGVGDLFVVRVAGNVAGLSELATIEYGVTHLGTPLLIVMGHTKCGAVTAAAKNAELHGHLPSLINLIKPAVEKAKASVPEEELVPRSIEFNVWQQVENIFAKSASVREFAAAGKVQIIGAVYDISTGKVQWLGQHPEIDRLLTEAKSDVSSHDEHAKESLHVEVPHVDAHAAAEPTPTPEKTDEHAHSSPPADSHAAPSEHAAPAHESRASALHVQTANATTSRISPH